MPFNSFDSYTISHLLSSESIFNFSQLPLSYQVIKQMNSPFPL